MGELKMNKKLYTQRNYEDLGQYFTCHVFAMTNEGLNSKAAIAGELAARDAEITSLTILLSDNGSELLKTASELLDSTSEVTRLKEQLLRAEEYLSKSLNKNYSNVVHTAMCIVAPDDGKDELIFGNCDLAG